MYFYIPNHSSNVATPVADPWTLGLKVPETIKADGKLAFRNWCKDPSTQHCFYSGYEGVSSTTRVTKEAPAMFLHHLVVDYDTAYTDSRKAEFLTAAPTKHLPAWVSTTFSGRFRVIWNLQKPVLLGGEHDLTKKFLEVLVKEMHLEAVLGGMDAKVYEPAQTFELGENWEKLSDYVIPSDDLSHWMTLAGRKLQVRSEVSIPMDKLAAEAEARWPGRWTAEFVEGARGVRFWDDTADCPTGCIVRKWGMQCFTGPRAIMTWADIFGKEFTSAYESKKLAPVVDRWFYDGKQYYRQRVVDTTQAASYGSGESRPAAFKIWMPDTRTDVVLDIKQAGFSSTAKVPGTELTEVEEVLKKIGDTKRVERALPFVHHKQGVIFFKGKLLLNTCSATCMEPAPEGSVISYAHGREEKFPWLAEFLHSFFEPVSQLEYFYAWWKWFYENGRALQPKPGQAIVIAGHTGVGKGFLSHGIIGRSVGGSIDAADYLVSGSQWTGALANSPVWCIDDASGPQDFYEGQKFTNMLKRITSNQTLSFNEKFQQTGEVTCYSRAIVTCNLDPESMRIMPGLDQSNTEKISFFRARSDNAFRLPGYDEQEAIVSRELPFLLRWLIDWKLPEHLRNDKNPRYGVMHYHDDDMKSVSARGTASNALAEVLQGYLSVYAEGNNTKTHWEGTMSQLHQEVSQQFPEIMRQWKFLSFQTKVSHLQSHGFDLKSYKEPKTGATKWKIPLVLEQKETK